MGYRRMDMNVLKAFFRRWMDGQSITEIHDQEGFDRKTIRTYIQRFESRGFQPGGQFADDDALDQVLAELLPANHRGRSKREQLEAYRGGVVAASQSAGFLGRTRYSNCRETQGGKAEHRISDSQR